ncbi:MAG TPA: helix-turn-helix domain-containing protein, partial [Candidatus Micrarchaeaceae archaeon]|nr:helix-turn-helix domain-containing protein [Candidatus Micrarchaeaceae archaeon]
MTPHLTLQQRQHARALRRKGKTICEIAMEIGCSLRTVKRVTHGPGKRESRKIVWSPGEHRLSLGDREEISRGLSAGEPIRAIARRIGRAPSTVSREVRANGGLSHYR